MTTATPPTLRTGKICYIEIPATDVQASAEFYRAAFGWTIRQRGDGATAFDDTVNEARLGRWDPTGNVMGLYQEPGLAEAEAQVYDRVSRRE